MTSHNSFLEKFEFRNIRSDETDQAIKIEQICFPPHEACSPKSMTDRINAAPEVFMVAVDKETGKIAGFLNGVATKEQPFRDEFFTDITLHDPCGENIMIMGLDVLPEYRGNGLAREIVSRYCAREKDNGRKMISLTCLPDKVEMYEKFGFTNKGKANSTWGNEEWYEMIYML